MKKPCILIRVCYLTNNYFIVVLIKILIEAIRKLNGNVQDKGNL